MNAYMLLVVAAVFVAAIAQILLKKSSIQKHRSWIFEYLNVYVIAGYGLMFVALLTNIFAMNRGVNLKFIPAIEALSYLFVPILSYFVFKERIGMRKVLAIALIMVGVVVFFM